MKSNKIQTLLYTNDNWDLCLADNNNLCTVDITPITGDTITEICLSGICSGVTYDDCYSSITSGCTYHYVECDLVDTTVCVDDCGLLLGGGWIYSTEGDLLDIDVVSGWTIQMDLTLIGKLPQQSNSSITSNGTITINYNCKNTQLTDESDENITGNTYCYSSGVTVNDLYPENEGIIYYKGLQKEYDIFDSSKLCELDCNGDRYLPDFEEVDSTLNVTGNSFNYFDNLGCSTVEYSNEIVQPNYCDNIDKNNLAIIVKPDGSIGYRRLELLTVCSGDTKVEDFTLVEKYSSVGVVNDSHTVTISFIPKKENCADGTVDGKLVFYVDGYEVFSTPFTEYITEIEYVSIGGGIIGNLCEDEVDQEPIELCTYCVQLKTGIILDSINISGETIPFSQEISVNEVDKLKNELQGILSGCTTVEVDTQCLCDGSVTNICFVNSVIEPTSIHCTDGMDVPVKLNRCITVEPNTVCGVLDQHFIGSFIGGIHNFKQYNKGITYSELQKTILEEGLNCK